MIDITEITEEQTKKDIIINKVIEEIKAIITVRLELGRNFFKRNVKHNTQVKTKLHGIKIFFKK